MEQILMIEDNIELAELIKAFLNRKGFSLKHFEQAEDALCWLKTHEADIILLDIMLPGMDGFAFMQQLRHDCETPVLIMSARGEKNDQLQGFTLGADDYIQKPVDPDILCAKIKVLLHRSRKQDTQQVLVSKALRIEIDAHKVYLNDKLLDLNTKEFDLLLLLVRNAGRTLQKEYLFNEIWGFDSESEAQTLTVHIKMLRSKIEENPKDPKRIQTVWGVGYRYEEV